LRLHVHISFGSRVNPRTAWHGTALLQLGSLVGLEMYATCSARTATVVSDLGGIPIDYQKQDFVKEIRRLTSDGVDAVFDGIGGENLWRSREALRSGGIVVVYGFTSKLRDGRLASGQPGGRLDSPGATPLVGTKKPVTCVFVSRNTR